MANRVLVVGNNVLIRTVTMHQVGKIERIGKKYILLSGASWVADSGRFHEALRDGKFREVEVPPDGMIEIAQGAIVDAYNWKHELPKQSV